MTVKEISNMLHISEPTVTQRARALISEGKMEPRKGRDWFFSEAEVELMRSFKTRERTRKPAERPAPAIGFLQPRNSTRRYPEGAEDVPREEMEAEAAALPPPQPAPVKTTIYDQ